MDSSTPARSHRHRWITAGLTIGAVLGGVGIAAAQTGGTTPPPAATAPTTTASTGTDNPSYHSSITVPETPDRSETTTAEAPDNEASDAALAALAMITPDQAKAAALVAHPGTASTPVVEDENGNVVYGVEITTKTGTVDVKVDAGTGMVLHADLGGADSGPAD